jgi:hypothetical protein
MSKMILSPWSGNLVSEGNVTYSETAHAWNTLRLHKQIVKEFPPLKDRMAKISFKIEFVRTLDNLKKKVDEIEKEKQGIPLLLYLYLDEPLK